jgi:proteasome accessory factor A
LRGRDAETDFILSEWGDALEALASEPEKLVGKVDWITKRWLLRQFCEQEKISWNHPWLKSQDLEFHQIDPARSLGLALAQTPAQWELQAKAITDAMTEPPANTRASVRSQAMHLLKQEGCAYYIDWEIIGSEGGNSLHMLNPFEVATQDAEHWIQSVSATAKTPRRGKVASSD